MQDTETFISKHANELQHALNVSLDASSNLNLSQKDKEDLQKDAIELVDDVLNDPDITKKEVKKFVKVIKKAKDKRKKQVMERG